MARTTDFDGYHKWLGITSRRRPPSHYELLGVSLNEDDHEVIQSAAEQRRRYVESKRGIGRDDQVSEILMRIDEAEITLLNVDLRREYDRQLQVFEKRRKNRQVDPNAQRTGFESKPGKVIGEDNGLFKTYAGIVAVICVAFAGMSLFAFNMLPWSKPTQPLEPAPVVERPPIAPAPVPVPVQVAAPAPVPVVTPPVAAPSQMRPNLVDVTTNIAKLDDTTASLDRPSETKTGQRQEMAGAAIFEGHHYKVFKETLDWHTAKARCEAMGGHLATISSDAENAFVTSLAKRTIGDFTNTGVWLGATDERNEGRWEWVDGTPFTYSAWFQGQPNNGGAGEHYLFLLLQFRGGSGNEFQGWCDQPRESKLHVAYFACEWETKAAALPSGSKQLNSPPYGFETLFNGTDFTNWSEQQPEHWSIRDGVLRYDGYGPKNHNLVSAKTYGDFELLVDWKVEPGADSGIYLRGKPQVQIKDDADGSGGLYNNKTYPNRPSVRADRPAGEWNTFRILMRGDKVTVYLNEQLVVDKVTLENYPSYSGPIPRRSTIELQQHTGAVEFRNLFIRDLGTSDSSDVTVGVPAPSRNNAEPQEEIVLLKDDSLSQWEPSPPSEKSKWSLKNGTLRLTTSGPSLVTKQKFRDFDLHLEFKLPPKCNSGVYLRGRYEIQLLDSQFRSKAGQPAPPTGRCCAIWGKIPATVDAYKGPNKWNTLDARLIGREVTVRLNDTLVIDRQTIDGVTGGALDTNEEEPGPILLQKSDVIGPEFRNIRIRPFGNQPESSQVPRARGRDSDQNSTSQVTSKFTPPENKCLLIIGQDKAAVDTYVRGIGHQPAGVMTYEHISLLGLEEASALRKAYPDAVIQIGLEFKGGLKEIPSGRFDANIDKLANWALSNPIPIYLRPGYECDGAHNQYPPDEYIAAFRYLRETLDRRGVQNIAYVWHVLPGNQPVERWWPGTQYVDWVGMTHFAAQKQNMATIAAFAKKHSKPLMLAEAAPRGIGTVKGKQSWNAWFRPCFEDIAQHDVRALSYINWDWEAKPMFRGGGWGDTRVEQNEFVKTEWLKEISKGKYAVSTADLLRTDGRP